MTPRQKLWTLTHAYPEVFFSASWHVRLATAHCTEADSRGLTYRFGSSASEDCSIMLNDSSPTLDSYLIPRSPSLTFMYVTSTKPLLCQRTGGVVSEQLSLKVFLAEQPSSMPKGNGTLIFPHHREQFALSGLELYSISQKIFKFIRLAKEAR